MSKQRVFEGLKTVFSVIGLLFSLWFVASLVLDLLEVDQTSGGYEYPYQGWTGSPIDYTQWYTTQAGMFNRGRVIDQHLDCTSGQLLISILGVVHFDFRPFSDRAKVVHQPQVSCWQRGFDTSLWDSIEDPQNLYTELTSSPEVE